MAHLTFSIIEMARKKAEDDERFIVRLETAMHKAARVRSAINSIITLTYQQRERELATTPWGREDAIKDIREDYTRALDAIQEMKTAIEAIDRSIRPDKPTEGNSDDWMRLAT